MSSSRTTVLFLALLPSTVAWSVLAHTVARPALTRPHIARLSAPTCNEEFTRREQMLVESRDPFRQARLFFFYPATIAGASVASWVSLTRLIAGLGGFREDTVPLTDGINLVVNVATAFWKVASRQCHSLPSCFLRLSLLALGGAPHWRSSHAVPRAMRGRGTDTSLG